MTDLPAPLSDGPFSISLHPMHDSELPRPCSRGGLERTESTWGFYQTTIGVMLTTSQRSQDTKVCPEGIPRL
jgi:hypothetical protein